ncbi:MAG: efflux RND transporter permease subunit, partial [Lachnospiraceae bacterium]|nr:efflux RND transporter permease subunit [Lachnospiraceae bacterium]
MLGKFSVKKPYTVLVAVVLAIVLGVVSFTKMSVDLLPSISLPYVIVMTTYPGASPETVEMVVTKPVEASMATVSNIEGISSVSSENYSVVILEFSQSTDMNAVSLEIRENLDQIKSYWSDSVGNPIIMKLNPDMLPVMIAAVGGVDMTEAEVSEMTQNTVIPALESIEGVASASAAGLVEDSVNVIIRQEKIDAINEQVFGYIDGEMEGAVQELADAKQEIQDGQAELEDARTEIESNRKKLEDSQKELNSKRKELEESKRQLEAGRAFMTEEEFAAASAQLEEGEAQLAAGQRQLNSALNQINAGEEQLNDSDSQLDDALQQVTDGETELEEARENAYEQADMSGILTVDTVKALLAAQNFSMPAGYVTEEGIDYLVRVGDKPEDIEVFKQMPIMNPEMDGVDVITLEDVADVFMTDNSDEIYANVNGEPGILITIQKQTGYSTGDVSDRILEKFEELKAEKEELVLITLMDQGIFIDLVMDSIINNVLFGSILAVLILILFLRDWRPTAVVACSIPISIITAIVCMYFSGVTLNVISLSGLALGVGMLVDNSIVVIENIYRLRNEGYSAKEAAVKGAGEVAGAITASTLTTVCVFLPIVFTEGITRQLFVDMGLTIAYSLLASLVIALTVVPAMASKMLTKTKEQKESRFFTTLIGGYEKLLALSLKGKPIVLLAVVALLVLSAIASYAKG